MYIYYRYTATGGNFNNIIILYVQMAKAHKKKLTKVNFHPNQRSALIIINFEWRTLWNIVT